MSSSDAHDPAWQSAFTPDETAYQTKDEQRLPAQADDDFDRQHRLYQIGITLRRLQYWFLFRTLAMGYLVYLRFYSQERPETSFFFDMVGWVIFMVAFFGEGQQLLFLVAHLVGSLGVWLVILVILLAWPYSLGLYGLFYLLINNRANKTLRTQGLTLSFLGPALNDLKQLRPRPPRGTPGEVFGDVQFDPDAEPTQDHDTDFPHHDGADDHGDSNRDLAQPSNEIP